MGYPNVLKANQERERLKKSGRRVLRRAGRVYHPYCKAEGVGEAELASRCRLSETRLDQSYGA
ncbi:hypothetical protein DMH88_08990 [Escherichia coli]|nr:hypothetical protein [Escherichia coli]